jgi:hypothetical protein
MTRNAKLAKSAKKSLGTGDQQLTTINAELAELAETFKSANRQRNNPTETPTLRMERVAHRRDAAALRVKNDGNASNTAQTCLRFRRSCRAAGRPA